ncbi:MAG: DUF115 domain-containing protein [Deltaproteobacteria bacterium]|nr:DUF115 domain-containing protein [Deltaproteobacteria bacterium]
MKLSSILERNRDLRGRHAGQRAFVVGNGPSLKKQRLEWLRHEITFTVNSFHRDPIAVDIASPYHVLADPAFWQEPAKHLLPVLQSLHDLNLPKTIFLPSASIPVVGKLAVGPGIDVRYFHYDLAADTPGLLPDLDFTSGIPQFGQTVTICALMCALYLGCNPIYLLGCDHDWFGWTEENYSTAEFDHSYERRAEETSKHADLWNFEQMTRIVKVMRYQYSRLREYAEARGIAVRNATAGGHLDVFPRVDFGTLTPSARGRIAPDELLQDALPDAARLARVVETLLESDEAAAALLLARESIRRTSGKFVASGRLMELEARALEALGLDQLAQARRSDSFTLAQPADGELPALAAAARDQIRALLVARGEALADDDRHERARALFRDAIRLDPKHAPSWNNLGVLYVAGDEPQHARRLLEHAVALDPADSSARDNLRAVNELLVGGDEPGRA